MTRRIVVIGHGMANSSPLFLDKQGWRNDHVDWLKPEVKEFRKRAKAGSSTSQPQPQPRPLCNHHDLGLAGGQALDSLDNLHVPRMRSSKAHGETRPADRVSAVAPHAARRIGRHVLNSSCQQP